MSARAAPPIEQVVETVTSWPGISTGEGRFGSTAFRVGGREIGHVHPGGAVDVGYPKPIRDRLIADGLTGEHHVLPDSNATTFHLESTDDVERAIFLLRLSYLYHASVLRRASDVEEEVADVDVEAEVERSGLSDELRAAFDRATGAG